MRGKFIVFEGPDGSGKTTQLKMFAEYLAGRGVSVVTEREPTGDTIGSLVRRVLSGELAYSAETLALLFAADRAEHIRRVDALLEEGRTVLCDRYVFSSIAYQGLELEPSRVAEINRSNIERLLPDAVVYIDLPAEECMARITRARETVEIFETRERIERVRSNYEGAFALLPPDKLIRIDGAKSPDEVAREVRERVEPVL